MTDKKRPGQVCLAWWGSRIRPEEETADAKRTRAALRRVTAPVEAVGVEAVHDLHHKLVEAGYDLRHDPARLMLIATALAAVKEHSPGLRAAMAFGESIGGRRRLGGIRFETLIRAKEPMELVRPLVRALNLIKGRADVAALSESLFYWSEKTRADWCFDYYSPPNSKEPKPNSNETEASA